MPRSQSACEQAEADTGRLPVLYLTHAEDVVHAVLPHSADVLSQLGEDSGLFSVAHATNAVDTVYPDGMSGCAAVVFFTSGELPLTENARDFLLDEVGAGLPVVGIHGAVDTYFTWDRWFDLMGARFVDHPWNQTVTLNVEDASHPSVAHVSGATVDLADQIMLFSEFRDGEVDVILSLDLASVDTTGVTVPSWGVPLSWSHRFSGGPVFVTALGHGASWDDLFFQQHVLGGLEWALLDVR